jgi:DNA-binding response OmpR family regulator
MGPLRKTVNLSSAAVLLVDASTQGMDILTQIFTGFGARSLHRCESAADARTFLACTPIDLMVVEAALPETDGYALVRWLRWSRLDPNATAPVILVAGHTRMRNITQARDCGANFIIAKPLTPQVLMDRILWMAQDRRSFVETDTYSGPDRRWRSLGPPSGKGRRSTDLSAKLGQATEPNLDQSDIDALMKPQRVSL